MRSPESAPSPSPATDECQCPHHPFGCYGHPDKCNCVSPSPSPADDVAAPLQDLEQFVEANNRHWVPLREAAAALSRLQAELKGERWHRDQCVAALKAAEANLTLFERENEASRKQVVDLQNQMFRERADLTAARAEIERLTKKEPQ